MNYNELNELYHYKIWCYLLVFPTVVNVLIFRACVEVRLGCGLV